MYHEHSFTLQLMGVLGEHFALGVAQPVGPEISLPAGLFSEPGHPLGLCNLDAIALPDELLDANWLLTGYRLSSSMLDKSLTLPLTDAQQMRRIQLPFIPAGCVQPSVLKQPTFTLSMMQRNPCPGWAERIHIYANPQEPFCSTAVMYLDGNHRIASIEMKDVELRHVHRESFYRVWIALGY